MKARIRNSPGSLGMALVLVACGGSVEGSETGGPMGGGRANEGGAPGGGFAGEAGDPGDPGGVGPGGNPSTGGAPSTGGVPSTGGSVPTGGRPVMGGAGGIAGGYVSGGYGPGGGYSRPPPPPPGCGNGVLDASEECDGQNLGGATCESVTMGALGSGFLRCAPDCHYEVSGCATTWPALYECLNEGAQTAGADWVISAACGSWNGGPDTGYCVPNEQVLLDAPLVAEVQDTCPSGEQCLAKSKVIDPSSCFVPCESSFGEGACVPTYIVEAPGSAGQGFSSTLGRVSCRLGETCVPCINPLDGTVTGACVY